MFCVNLRSLRDCLNYLLLSRSLTPLLFLVSSQQSAYKQSYRSLFFDLSSRYIYVFLVLNFICVPLHVPSVFLIILLVPFL